MSDLTSQALSAVASGTTWAPLLVFGAGIVSGVGPCAASRGLLLGAMVPSRSGVGIARAAAAFAAGLATTYAAIGFAATMAATLLAFSSWAYGVTAVVLVACGIRGLCDERRCCGGRAAANDAAAFVVGAGSALTVSPCCAPLMLGIVAYASASGDPRRGGLLLALFAVGHLVPMFAGLATASLWKGLRLPVGTETFARTTAAGISIALGAMYGLLA